MKIWKKILACVLSTTLLISTMPFMFVNVAAASWGFDDPTKEEGGNESAYTEYNTKQGRLFNFYKKIRDLSAGDSLNIAYFGGSITSGSGSTKFDVTSWRGIIGEEITELVRQYHPDQTVTNRVLYPADSEQYDDTVEGEILVKNINAAVGASSSFFGAYRAFDDIGLDKGTDLVFLEFSYNDYCGDNYTRTYKDKDGNDVIAFAAEYESIIREIYRYAPDCDIIGIFTTGSYQKTSITEDRYPQLSVERAILREYDIPYLYIGKELVEKVLELDPNAASVTEYNCTSNAAWMTYFCDTCHPNDNGYAFYANLVKTYLTERLDAASAYENGGGTIEFSNASLDNSYFDLSVLKSQPNQVRIADLYTGHEDYLSGFERYDISEAGNDRAYISHRSGSLCSEFSGSSLAFRFTGDALGMWAMTTKNGGNITANIYEVKDGVRGNLYKTVTKCFDSAYDFLPGIFDIAGQLPYATYDVEIITSESGKGSSAKISRIFWNGSDEISPLMHPDIPIIENYTDIEILNSFVAFEENYGITVKKGSEDEYVFTATTDSLQNPYKLVRYDLTSKGASLANYPFVIIEYFIDEDSDFPFNKMTMRARTTSSMTGDTMVTRNYSSSELKKGEWATAVIDMSTYLSGASASGATPQSYWKRMEFYPFGDSVNTSTDGMNNASIKIRSIRFSHYNSSVDIEEGEKTVFVSHSGLVTLPDTAEFPAYTTFSEAFDALGEEGGIIYFQGAYEEFVDGTKPHGDVRVIGIGDSEIQRKQNKIIVKNASSQALNKNGNLTLENLCISHESSPRNTFFYTNGHTLTFGENVINVSSAVGSDGVTHLTCAAPYVAAGNTGPSSNFVFSAPSATFDIVASMGAISASYWSKYTGHVNYVFNAGTFKKAYMGAVNAGGTAALIGYGDVTYTVNGGTFTVNNIYTGAMVSGSRYGNVTLIFNGGSLQYDVIHGADYQGTASVSNPGYTSVIVNCKEITKAGDGDISNNTNNRLFGRTVNKGGVSDHNMVIFNNAELASKAKVAFADSVEGKPMVALDYRIQAFEGKVIPVFEESSTSTSSTSAGALLGFKIEADSKNYVPYCNGEKLSIGKDGLYQLPNGTVNITFEEGAVYGDANNDSKIDICDLVSINEYINNESTDINILNADLDGDGKVTELDLTALKKELLG